MSSASSLRRGTTAKLKWHPPAPPTPRILHLPRRTRKPRPSPPSSNKTSKPHHHNIGPKCRGKLETLFDQERAFSRTVPVVLLQPEQQCRERVDGCREREEDSWIFQAELLRAECNLLRMERRVAEEKWLRRRSDMVEAMRSVVHTLNLERKKLCKNPNLQIVLHQQVRVLQDQIEEMQRDSEEKEAEGHGNFDRRTSFLRRKLAGFRPSNAGEDEGFREIREIAEQSLSITHCCTSADNSVSDPCNRISDIMVLREKLETLWTGMTESRRAIQSNNKGVRMEKKECSNRCKSMVRKVLEHVQAEAEQWCEVQEVLDHVRLETEELQRSRDFWEDRALEANEKVETLQIAMHEWRHRARSSEKKLSELRKQFSRLQQEMDEKNSIGSLNQTLTVKTERTKIIRPNNDPLELEKENESSITDKRVLVCRLRKEKKGKGTNRSPLKEIGNSSPLFKPRGAVFPINF
ncbi:hypothetical protein AMTRI_Chr03g45650 [Amborella trichopoda]